MEDPFKYYSGTEVAEFLAPKLGFNLAEARKHYTDEEIAKELHTKFVTTQAKPVPVAQSAVKPPEQDRDWMEEIKAIPSLIQSSLVQTAGAARYFIGDIAGSKDLKEEGRSILEGAKIAYREDSPAGKPTFAQEMVEGAATSLARMMPSMVVSAFMSPAVGLGMMGSDTFVNAYSTARDGGKGKLEALRYGLTQSAFDVIPEGVAMKKILQKGTPLFNRIVNSIAWEGGSEAVTEVAQKLDSFVSGLGEKTWGEFWDAALHDVPLAAATGGLTGGPFGAIAHVADTMGKLGDPSKVNGDTTENVADIVKSLDAVMPELDPAKPLDVTKLEPVQTIETKPEDVTQDTQQAEIPTVQTKEQDTAFDIPQEPPSEKGVHFPSESELRQKSFEEVSAKHKLSPEAIADLRPAERPDPVTGFSEAADRIPTVERAIKHVEATGEKGVYVEVDIRNLSGGNNKLGHSGANTQYRAIADVVKEEVEAEGGTVHFNRHGGDEFNAVAIGPGITPERVSRALDRAQARIDVMMKEAGLDQIDHPKHKGDPAYRGMGVTYALGEIEPGRSYKDLFSQVDKQVELNKEERANVFRRQTEAAGAVPLEGQTGGTNSGIEEGVGRGQAETGTNTQTVAVETAGEQSAPQLKKYSPAPETPAFKQWSGGSPVVAFDESHSKKEHNDLVDARRPAIYRVFHGTRASFSQFTKGLNFFTPSADVSSGYAGGAGGNRPRINAIAYENEGSYYERVGEDKWVERRTGEVLDTSEIEQELQAGGSLVKPGESIMPVYVRLNRPLDLRTQEGIDVIESLDSKGDRFAKDIVAQRRTNAWTKRKHFDWGLTKDEVHQKAWRDILIPQLQAKGYDGLVFPDDLSDITLATFTPEQVKSVTGNRGTYDSANPDIRFSPTEGAVTNSSSVDDISSALGVKVERFTGDTSVQGYVDPKTNTVHINEQTADPAAFVLGHEFTHVVRREQPDLYDQLAEASQSEISDAEVDAYNQKRYENFGKDRGEVLTRDQAREEMVADRVGKKFLDPVFLQKIKGENPTMYQRVIKVIQQVLEKLRSALTTNPGNIDQVTRLDDLIEAVTLEYKTRLPGNVGGEIMYSPADIEGGTKKFQESPSPETLRLSVWDSLRSMVKTTEKVGRYEVTWQDRDGELKRDTLDTLEEAKAKADRLRSLKGDKAVFMVEHGPATEVGNLEYILSLPEFMKQKQMQQVVESAHAQGDLRNSLFNEVNTAKDGKQVSRKLVDMKEQNPEEYKKAMATCHWADRRKWNATTAEEKMQITEAAMRKAGMSDKTIEVWKDLRRGYDQILDREIQTMMELAEKGRKKGADPKNIKVTLPEAGGGSQTMTLDDLIKQYGSLKGTYMPRIREGDYYFKAVTPDGIQYRKHGTKWQVNRWRIAAQKLGYTKISPILEVERLPEPVYQDLSVASLQQAISQAVDKVEAPLDSVEAVERQINEALANLIKERGHMRHSIRRGEELVLGYEEDLVNGWLKYSMATTAGIAKTKASVKYYDILRLINAKKEPRTYQIVAGYIRENLRNSSAMDRKIAVLKSFAMLKYLWANPKTAAVNITSLITTSPAAIRTYASDSKAGLAKCLYNITKAVPDYLRVMANKSRGKKNLHLTADEQRLVQDIQEQGWDAPELVRENQLVLQTKLGQIYQSIIHFGMLPQAFTERVNRGVTMLAAYRVAKAANPKLGYADWEVKARKATERSQGKYGKEYQHLWAQGEGGLQRIAQLSLTFTKFPLTYLQSMKEMGMDHKDARSVLYMMLSPALLAGAAASPLYWLTGAADQIAKGMGDDRDQEKRLWDWLRKEGGESMETLARYGTAGYMFGVNISGSLEPNFGMLAPSKPSEVFGAVGGVWNDFSYAYERYMVGDTWNAALKIPPVQVSSIMKAIWGDDELRTGKGRPILTDKGQRIKISDVDKLRTALGFQTASHSRYKDIIWEKKKENANFVKHRAWLYEKARQLDWQDSVTVIKFINEVRAYNEIASQAGYQVITRDMLSKKAKELK